MPLSDSNHGRKAAVKKNRSSDRLARPEILAVGKYGFTLYGPGISAFAADWPVTVSGVGFGMVTATLSTLA